MVDETIRNEIIHLARLGHSGHEIARQLRVSRNTVRSVLRTHEAARHGSAVEPKRRSKLDGFDDAIRETLTRAPGIPVTELLQMLQLEGYVGSYTILRERVRQLRPLVVEGNETWVAGPGIQADVGVGRRELESDGTGVLNVALFKYRLKYSRFTRLRFIHSQDLISVLYQLTRAFESSGGVPTMIACAGISAILQPDRRDINPLFLKFANHYGFKPTFPEGSTRGTPPTDPLDEFLAGSKTIYSLCELNYKIAERERERANDMETGLDDRFDRERKALIPLPDQPWCG